ncbi:MAG TPA: hypothetical protein VFK59_10670 [Actinomycetota bacterium]|nr:hypothetical protein [Actinomycetota bacterium]
MLYRQRMHFFPKSQEAWMELVKLGDEYNKLAADKGWTQGTFWMPVAGETEVVAEWDYADMATYERETLGMFNEPDLMALGSKIWAIESVRAPYSELLNPMPSFP